MSTDAFVPDAFVPDDCNARWVLSALDAILSGRPGPDTEPAHVSRELVHLGHEDLAHRLFGTASSDTKRSILVHRRPVGRHAVYVYVRSLAPYFGADSVYLISPLRGRHLLIVAPAELSDAEGEVYRSLRTGDHALEAEDALAAARGVLSHSVRKASRPT